MIKVEKLIKTYKTSTGDHVKAVQDISFEVEKGSFYTLLGPSGCGKSTTLRCVAGLEQPDTGEITVGERIVFSPSMGVSVSPHHRNIGMVFQSYAIWPHMTVYENVAFPLKLKRKKLSSSCIKKKVQKALDTVKLSGLEQRPAPQLSGGQQQRLALARALVREPDIMLLDEPLSNLDAKLRETMRIELKELLRQLNITTLFVTHDQVEALALSTKIAVINKGEIIQEATPEEIYAKPKCRFVADFIGSSNFINGTVTEIAAPGNLSKIRTEHGLMLANITINAKKGDSVSLCIRPENIIVESKKPSFESNVLLGKIKTAIFLGEYRDVTISLDKDTIKTRLSPHIPLTQGDNVYIYAPPETTVVVEA